MGEDTQFMEWDVRVAKEGYKYVQSLLDDDVAVLTSLADFMLALKAALLWKSRLPTLTVQLFVCFLNIARPPCSG